MGNVTILSLLLSSDNIFVGTEGFSVWKRALSELLSVRSINNSIPDEFNLFQNYPNPFNPTTTIRFDIQPSLRGEGGRGVRLIVYDILGREVATLVNEQLKPGTYEVEFDGSIYTSGIYFYKLITNDYVESKRMVLVK
jgi:hypothetical protein